MLDTESHVADRARNDREIAGQARNDDGGMEKNGKNIKGKQNQAEISLRTDLKRLGWLVATARITPIKWAIPAIKRSALAVRREKDLRKAPARGYLSKQIERSTRTRWR